MVPLNVSIILGRGDLKDVSQVTMFSCVRLIPRCSSTGNKASLKSNLGHVFSSAIIIGTFVEQPDGTFVVHAKMGYELKCEKMIIWRFW